MSTPRWPVVLFDFDGTVADTIDLIVASYDHASRTVVNEVREPKEIRSWIGRSLDETFESVWPGRGTEMIRVYREFNAAHHDEMIRPYAGIAELLQALRSAEVRLGVVTSKRRETARQGVKVLGFTDLPILATLQDTTHHKPSPDPLLFAAAEYDVDPANCVYIGDAVVDMQAAQAAGMDGIAVTWGSGTREELSAQGPAAVVSTVPELKRILLGD